MDLTRWSWTITLERSVGWTNVKSVPLRSISLEKNYFQTILCYLNTISLVGKCWWDQFQERMNITKNNHLLDSWMGENCSQQLIGDHGEAVLELQLLDLVSRQRLRWSFENISGNISICSQEGICRQKMNICTIIVIRTLKQNVIEELTFLILLLESISVTLPSLQPLTWSCFKTLFNYQIF